MSQSRAPRESQPSTEPPGKDHSVDWISAIFAGAFGVVVVRSCAIISEADIVELIGTIERSTAWVPNVDALFVGQLVLMLSRELNVSPGVILGLLPGIAFILAGGLYIWNSYTDSGKRSSTGKNKTS